MHIKNMKIGQRLALGFGAVLALLALIVSLALGNMAATNKALVKIVESNNVRLEAATTMRDAQRHLVIALRDLVLVTDEEEMVALGKEMDTAWQDYKNAESVLDKKSQFPATRAILARIVSARTAATPLIEKAAALGRQNKTEEATVALRKEVVPLTTAWQKTIKEIIDQQTARNQQEQEVARQQYESSRLLVIGISSAAIAAALVISWLITRSVTRPMSAAVRVAQAVAAGDLTSRIEVSTRDETGQLLQALKAMNASLQDIVARVRGGTDAIATASSEIARGNLDLSSRTEQQASSLEETASSMEELTSTVKQNAENARQANELAASASSVAKRGGAVVENVVQTMGAINESASKIVDIISVIDGIAFQTNILALNAAVEAARAGEQGRGFAVVASEVRNLAQRSASAAKEIKALINDSVDKVGEGSRLVHEAGATMQELLASVRRVTDIMGEITMASREQETGIEQINTAISEMDTVTQQNAALVEEAAAAAQSLQEQSGSLAESVAVFRLADTGRPDGAMHAAKTAAKNASNKAAAATVVPVRAATVRSRPALATPAARSGAAVAQEEWETF